MAKVIDHIKNSTKTLFSLEILPPSTGESIQNLFNNLSPLMEFKPKFIDVTYHREEFVYKKMPNGLNVVTIPYDSPGLAAFYIVVRVGSRDEVEAGKTGFAHFFEHMMFRGTDKYPKEKYSDELKATGATLTPV